MFLFISFFYYNLHFCKLRRLLNDLIFLIEMNGRYILQSITYEMSMQYAVKMSECQSVNNMLSKHP